MKEYRITASQLDKLKEIFGDYDYHADMIHDSYAGEIYRTNHALLDLINDIEKQPQEATSGERVSRD